MSDHNTNLRYAVRHLRSTPPRLLEEPHQSGAIAEQGKSMGPAFSCYHPGINRQPQPQCAALPSAEPHHRDLPNFVVCSYDDCWTCRETHDAPPVYFIS